MRIYASLIEAYIFCPRQAWLMSRQITGNQYNEFLAIGRIIAEESYKREKKEILIDGGKIDVISKGKEGLLLIEVKKSSKHLKTSKMQLLYYLYKLSQKGHKVKGEIRIPEEKKVIPVDFSEKEKKEIEKLEKELKEMLEKDNPPEEKWKNACKKCSYLEFCWS